MKAAGAIGCPAASPPVSVSVTDVVKVYGTQRALDGVRFDVPSGQVVGFLGPNGAGKSTMMKIICCYLPATSGSVSVNGFDVVTQSVEVRRLVGYLPEHNPLYHEMYVREYLTFVAGLHRIRGDRAAKRVDEMIALTGLGPERAKKIGALSRGYRQRVGLAQAMIHNPPVLVMDEPTSGLDPNQLMDVRTLIRELGKEKTVILSTHIMQEVEAICDRVIIINKGRIVADDSTRVLQRKMAGEKVFTIEFDKPVEREALEALPGVDSAVPEGGRWRIRSEGDSDIRDTLFRFAVSGGLVVRRMDMEENSLEEVFHRLTAT